MDISGIIWLLCVGGCAAAFTGIGIYAYRREEPMFFWSGSTVRREELTDVEAYNHANGIMWIVYSIPMWFATISYFWIPRVAVTLMVIGCTAGLGVLIFAYQKIYRKYRKYKR